MTVSELVCMNVGDTLTVKPLLKLGGLDLGGAELILATRAGNTSSFVVKWLGVRIGCALATVKANGVVDWSFEK